VYSRQRAILRLLQNEGGTTSRLRLVKLAFLLSRELDVPRSGVYEFLPYRRGPFSFTLYYDFRALENKGWLAEAESDVRLAQGAEGETALLTPTFLKSIDSLSSRHRAIPTPELVDSIYANHPWFTVNSDSIHKRATPRPEAQSAVYTIGYEGLMVDGLLDLLLRKGIQRLIDIRCNPVARRYGFHKSTLSKLCHDVGIEYLHVPSLGIPSTWRADLGGPASYQQLFTKYENEILPLQQTSIEAVAELLQARASALMCMEADHSFCHRSRLAALVSRRTDLPIVELR
jgi:uncharacterized protein (DUF488 family)